MDTALHEPWWRAGWRWLASALTPIIVAGFFLFLWEAATPESLSAARPIAEFSGVLDAVAMEVRAEEEAKYVEMLAEAEEEGRRKAQLEYEPQLRRAVANVDRLSTAYQSIFAAYGDLARQAYQIEGQLIGLQSRQIAGTQVVDQIGANVAAGACLLGMFADDPTLRESCRVADSIRNDIAGDYVDPLQRNRTVLPRQLIESFPLLQDLLDADLARMQAELEAAP